jgi:ubiquitin-conjugating enzyme E2 T
MPLDAHAIRRQADIAKLQELQTEFRGTVSVTRTAGTPVNLVELEIKLRTARNERFPDEAQVSNAVQIQLPARYPFEPPKVTVKTPIWNPNIFTSGLICLGQQWIPSHNLALLVQRVMQIVALDPAIINLKSPANSEAAKWYATASRRNPAQFPTVQLDSLRASVKPTIQWRTIK